MSRTWWTGMAVVAAILAATALASVESKKARTDSAGGDLTGTWVLDLSRSDLPAGPGERRWRGRGAEGGSRSDDGAPRGEARGPRRGGRGFRMPNVMQVTQTGGNVSFADSAGALVQVVRVGGAADSPASGRPVRELTGRWEDGTLIAEGSGPRGGTIVRSYRLTDGGRALEVRTQRNRRSGRGELTLIYRRAS